MQAESPIREQTRGGKGADLSHLHMRALETAEDREAFRTLNEEWIVRYFSLEPKDTEILNNPDSYILSKGGHIFMAEFGDRAVGCVALIPVEQGVYELSKMAVSPELRGLGIGRRLLDHAVDRARAIGATSLILGSSTKLGSAIHLYESIGFRHVAPEKLPSMIYVRADVFMEMDLKN